jgi:hypothetical protein
MEFLVVGAMVLLAASFLYPPLGRSLRNIGRRVEADGTDRTRRITSLETNSTELEAPPAPAPAVAPPPSPQAAAPAPSPQDAAPSERPQFGKKRVAVEEPKRPDVPPSGQIFNKELFEGEMGDFLRKHGYAPDDPRNQAPNVQPLSVLLAEDLAELRRANEAVNKAANFRIEPWHLLPFELWHGEFGPWLRQELDLSPCRPWNTIFLPADEAGAKELGLPIAPAEFSKPSDEALAVLSILREIYAGLDPAEGKAVKIMLAGVRSATPQLFPNDIGDFSDRVREARADVRALAFITASTSGAVGKDTIVKSQDTFLGKPEQQLVS